MTYHENPCTTHEWQAWDNACKQAIEAFEGVFGPIPDIRDLTLDQIYGLLGTVDALHDDSGRGQPSGEVVR